MTMLLLGGLNTGCMGMFAFNPAAYIFGVNSLFLHLFYNFVGMGAVIFIFALINIRFWGD